ncbi:hypothetical protein N7509_002096 [Penicillium cosmopolitanum]|uniref:J domain-containing protein n=1 Tax=Penicillium cosmopolitanum TaxID=1131564 RepID=A0A9W9W8C3_9EURO|nr:uncharacterized protein N7509_002096 [Penicillium cosmopolitanum]KAJ5408213.1 hypothetical protein N7509_002096 [Penicillium cosmopolitanum]
MAFRAQSIRHLSRPVVSNLTTQSSRSGISRTIQRNASMMLSQHRAQPAQSQTTLSRPQPSILSSPSPSLNSRFASTKSGIDTAAGESSLVGAPDITNYYTIFPLSIPSGPPPSSPFEISISDLRREFLQLQGLIHPDKYPSGEAKQHAEALSARINEAYRTLADPLQRAQYLLREWHGIDVTAEDASTKHALDAQTLMEVMEVQETIEEVGASPEAEAEIEALKAENEMRIMGGDIEGARQECIRLRFWYSVGEGLREWEPGSTEIRLVHSH